MSEVGRYTLVMDIFKNIKFSFKFHKYKTKITGFFFNIHEHLKNKSYSKKIKCTNLWKVYIKQNLQMI